MLPEGGKLLPEDWCLLQTGRRGIIHPQFNPAASACIGFGAKGRCGRPGGPTDSSSNNDIIKDWVIGLVETSQFISSISCVMDVSSVFPLLVVSLSVVSCGRGDPSRHSDKGHMYSVYSLTLQYQFPHSSAPSATQDQFSLCVCHLHDI